MIRKVFSRLVSYTGAGTALQEVLYGFIMALIFVYGARFGLLEFESPVSFMLTVTGMCVTWGVIDGVIFYLIWSLDVKRQYKVLADTEGRDRGSRLDELVDSFSGTPMDVLSDSDKRRICEQMLDMNVQSEEELRSDRSGMIKNSAGCVFFSILALVPILLPLFFIDDFMHALWVSSMLSVVFLFFVGYGMAPYIGTNRFFTGVTLAGISLIISVISVFTGG